MRDRLIEILKGSSQYITEQESLIESIADFLLENGVIVPPCKVGDKLYVPAFEISKIIECEVTQVRIIYSKHKGKTIQIYFNSGNMILEAFFTPDDFKNGLVFLSKKEAEQALRKEK